MAKTDNNTQVKNMNSNLQIQVSNFGPITEGEVCVKPLTIFVGPSNTGKSYLAILLYTLFKTFFSFSSRRFGYFYDHKYDMLENLIKLDQLGKLLKDNNNNGFIINDKKLFEILKKSINSQQIQVYIKEYLCNSYLVRWRKEIDRCLASLSQLKNSQSIKNRDLKIGLSHNSVAFISLSQEEKSICQEWLEAITEQFLEHIPYKRLQPELHFFMRQLLKIENQQNLKQDQQYRHKRRLLQRFSFDINRYFSRFIIDYFEDKYFQIQKPVYYFPAARTGIMQSHKSIVSSMISRSTQVGIREDIKIPTLSGCIADFLEKLVNIDPKNQEKTEETIYKVVDEFEENVFKGQVEVKINQFGYPDFIYKKDGLEIPMQRASSMVTELAPIVSALKYYVRKGNTLIIEEPEAHLHPKAQKDIGDVLVALVKNGVNVIITTHNETLLQQISNYLMSQSIPEEKRKEIIGSHLSLSEDDLAIYNFVPQKGQKDNIIIKEIPFDSEHGISIDDHNEVSTKLYDQTVDIQDEVEIHKNKSESA